MSDSLFNLTPSPGLFAPAAAEQPKFTAESLQKHIEHLARLDRMPRRRPVFPSTSELDSALRDLKKAP